MKTPANGRFVGAVANRDPELMAQLKSRFASFGVGTVDLSPDAGFDTASLARHDIDLVLVKLTSYRANGRVLGELRKGNFSYLNSLRSVRLCQSRRAMFAFANRQLPDVKTPRMLRTPVEARQAIERGGTVWVRRDSHNIPTVERVLGVARSPRELEALIGARAPHTLFFQEYLGSTNEMYKAYVVGTSIVGLKRTGRQNGVDPDRELTVERVSLEKRVEDVVLRIGKSFGMAVYGVDLLYRDGEPTYIDINDFPSFRGIPEACDAICELAASRYFPASLVPAGAKTVDRPE